MSPPLSYRADALGQASPLLAPHLAYLALWQADNARRVACLFHRHLDGETISGIRLALIP